MYAYMHTVHIFTITSTLPPHTPFYLHFLAVKQRNTQGSFIWDQIQSALVKGTTLSRIILK